VPAPGPHRVEPEHGCPKRPGEDCEGVLDAVGSPEGWAVGLERFPAQARGRAAGWTRRARVASPGVGASAEAAARDVGAGRPVHPAHHDRPVGLQLDPGGDHLADGPLLG
jgi:hypothetical protein